MILHYSKLYYKILGHLIGCHLIIVLRILSLYLLFPQSHVLDIYSNIIQLYYTKPKSYTKHSIYTMLVNNKYGVDIMNHHNNLCPRLVVGFLQWALTDT